VKHLYDLKLAVHQMQPALCLRGNPLGHETPAKCEMEPSPWDAVVGQTLQVNNGAILVPAGVYRITKTLDTRKNIVLRGAGKTLTMLYFPLSLTQVYGNTWSEVSRGCQPASKSAADDSSDAAAMSL
jgi:hypothetical protein